MAVDSTYASGNEPLKQKLSPRLKQNIKNAAAIIVRSPVGKAITAARLAKLAANRTTPICLNLGCGARHLPGWINLDISPFLLPPPDVLLDLKAGIPLANGTVDFLLSEDFIEHIDEIAGRKFLKECWRVLKPGGTLRLLTPDLLSFAKAYVNRSQADLQWYQEVFGVSTFAEMFNAGMREWGHTFLYDEETLLKVASECGFTAVRTSFGESTEATLRNIDLRNNDDGAHTMYFDCRKQ